MAGQVRMSWLDVDTRALVAPSLLSANPLAMLESIDRLQGKEDWLHVDIMDGHFVPNLTYGPTLVSSLRGALPHSFLDVHLMVSRPEDFILPFAEAGASLLTVHFEACVHLHRVLQQIKASGCRTGVAINPATCVEQLFPILHCADLVLVMSVNPGFGGQAFIPEVLEKTETLCRWRETHRASFCIQMDGGIGVANAATVARSGCDVLVAGNAVFGSSNPLEALKKIQEQTRKEQR